WLRMMVGEVSQPSRFRTPAASPFHSVASFTQRRSRNSRPSKKRRVSSTAGSLSGSGSTGGGFTTTGAGLGGGGAGGGAGARSGSAAAGAGAAGRLGAAGFGAGGFAGFFGSVVAPGLSGALSAPSRPASSCPILATRRAAGS